MLKVEINIVKKEGYEDLCSPVILVYDDVNNIVPIALPSDIRLEDGLRLSAIMERIVLKNYKTIEELKRDYYKH